MRKLTESRPVPRRSLRPAMPWVLRIPARSRFLLLGAALIALSVSIGLALWSSGPAQAQQSRSSDATLSGLELLRDGSGIALRPAFDSQTVEYGATVPLGNGWAVLRPTASHSGATITVGGSAVKSGSSSDRFFLHINTPLRIEVVVTAEDGVTRRVYALTATHSPVAELADLTVSRVKLHPLFSGLRADYRGWAPYSVERVTVTPVNRHDKGTITVNGQEVASGESSPEIALTEGENVITVTITSPDRYTSMTYTITVVRASASASGDATLRGLSVHMATSNQPDAANEVPYASEGYSLSPELTAGVYEYRVRLPEEPTGNDLTHLYVTTVATTAAPGAKSIVVSGKRSDEEAREPKREVVSGESSGPWQTFLGYGLISVEVTSLDGMSTLTYRVILERGSVDDPRGVKVTPGDGQLTLSWEENTGTGAPTLYWARWREAGTERWLNGATLSGWKTGYGDGAPDGTSADGQRMPSTGSTYVITGLTNGTEYEVELRGTRGGDTSYRVTNWLKSEWVAVRGTPGRGLTITPSAPRREYGGVDDLGYTVGGLVDGDAAGDVVAGALSRAAGDDAGSYAFDMSGLSVAAAYAGKYVLPSAPVVADYTITPRAITAISGVRVNGRPVDGTTDATFDTSAAEGAGVLASELGDFRAGGLVVSGVFPAATAGTHSLSVTYSLQDHASFKATNYTLSDTTDTLQGEITVVETPVEDCEPTELAPTASVSFVADTDLNAVNINDLTLVSLTLPECATITPEFRPDHYEYTVTVPDHISRLEIKGRFIDRWTGRRYEPFRFGFIAVGDLVAFDQAPWSNNYMFVASSSRVWNTRLVGLNPGVAETVEIGLYKWKPEGWGDRPYSENTINRAYTLTLTRGGQHPSSGDAPQDPSPVGDDDGEAAAVPFAVSIFGDYKHLATVDELTLPPGASIVPEFRPDHYEYTVSVPNHISQLDFRGRLISQSFRKAGVNRIVVGDLGVWEQRPQANDHMVVAESQRVYTWQGAGKEVRETKRVEKDRSVALRPGVAETVEIGLYSYVPNAGHAEHRFLPIRKTYTLTIIREAPPSADNATLYDLTSSAGYLDFRRNTTAYTLYVQRDMESLVLTPRTLHSRATVTVNGEDPATPVALTYGENLIEVVVMAADGDSTQTYEVTVNRVPPDPGPGDFSELIVQIQEWRNNTESSPSRAWIMYATARQTYATYRAHTDRWDRALLAFGAPVADTSLRPMTSYEGQTLSQGITSWTRSLNPMDTPLTARALADRSGAWSRWVPVVAALRELEHTDSEGKYTALITQMYEWRNDPCCASDKAHTDRWDRALLAFGAPVADTTLTPMTADEAQALADRGWTRWTEVAAALRELESGGQPDTPNSAPTVSAAPGDITIVNEGGTQQVSLSGVFSDADSDSLTITAASSDEAVATVSVASGYSSLTVSAQSRGTATVTVTADDGNGGTVSDTFTVTVKAAPVVVTDLSSVTGLEVGTTGEVSVSDVFSDEDGDALTITAASSDEAVATVAVASDGSALTLAGVSEGTAIITVTAQDTDGNTVSDTFEAPVAKRYAALIAQMKEWRNDPCCASDEAHTDRWDRALLAFGETVADTTLLPMTADEAQGYADRGWERWVDVAAALREIESGGRQQQQGTPNSAPTVSSAIADATIVSESGTQQVSLSGVFSDADSDSLTITAASSDETKATVLVSSGYSSLTVSARSRGAATVTVTADDGNGSTVDDTFTVRVKAAPVVESAISDISGLEAGLTTRDIALSGVFSDADGDSLTITATSSNDAKATVSVASDGSALTLAGVSEGTAMITVTAQDSDGNTVSDAFDVSVSGEHAALITQMYEWRNDPRYVSDKAHTDRWDRALLAFGETIADTTLTPMTADEAQALADRGWTRWTEVAAALRELESRGQQQKQGTPNSAPTVSAALGNITIVNESGTQTVSLTGVFSDADSDSLTITAASSDETKATVSVASDRSSLTVSARLRGTATITATADDGNGGTVDDTFTVRVKAAPVVASAIGDISGLEAGSTREVSLSGVFSDADGDTLTVSAASSDEARATGTVAADQSKLTVAGVAEGTATITVTARDSDGNRVGDAFDVSVPAPQLQVNQPPTVAANIADATLINESGTKQVSLTGVFSDADALTISAASSDETKATVWVASDRSSLTVSARLRGTATITVTADDGNGGTVEDAFTVTVKAAPVLASAIADVSLEVGDNQDVSLRGVFSDADTDTLTVSAASSADAIATVTVAADRSKLTVAGVAEGTATITVTAQDSDGNAVSDAFDVSVAAPQQDPPPQDEDSPTGAPTVAKPLADVSLEGPPGWRAISLSGVFHDPDGDDLILTVVSSDHGVASMYESVFVDGSTLTVLAMGTGTATITVTAEDPDGNRVSDEFEVTVTPPAS